MSLSPTKESMLKRSMESNFHTTPSMPESLHGPNKLSQQYHRKSPMVGYTGYFPCQAMPEDELDKRCEKYMIRGATGFRPLRNQVIAEARIPSEDKQVSLRSGQTMRDSWSNTASREPEEGQYNFRMFAKHLDTVERYNLAVEQIKKRGQTQEMLLRILQAKLSERVSSYSAQMTRTRRLFDTFDRNKDLVLDEGEFRLMLEELNIQFDDVQVLALFAFFDQNNNDGFLEFEDFANYAMVQNPQGATCVIPKLITSISKTTSKDIMLATSCEQTPKAPANYPISRVSSTQQI